jgi:FkbH-like protein
MPLDDRVIAIGATFTAEAIQPGLAFWAGELGLEHEIRFAGYNQLFQVLLDRGGLFARNRRGFNVALVRLEDWLTAGLETSVCRLLEAVRAAAGSFPAPLILAVCPPSPANEAAVRPAEGMLLDGVAGLGGVHSLSHSDVLAMYPVEEVHDPHGEELGHLPYTPEFFVALATAVARRIHAISMRPFKVAAIDCDETLWAGICGEDGPQNVAIDAPRRALQEFMAARRGEGLLLALCSKNNEEDVLETFRAHPEMPLQLKDFAARRLNWDSKAANLAALAAELDLGLDSFIMVDDSPKECDEAQAGAPEVLVLALPSRSDEIPQFLEHVWAFDRARVTEEDRQRPEWYAQHAQRVHAQRTAASLPEFLDSLELEIGIEPMQPAQAARIAQLTQRTNQMNTTCVRRTEAEIRALRDAEILAVTVKDRFGSYGLTGAVIFRAAGESLDVDTFLLSCRALGRGVEHRMIARLGEMALERGVERISVPFVRAQRNRPAELFLNSLGAADAVGVYRFSAKAAASVTYRPAAASAAVVEGSGEDVRKRPSGQNQNQHQRPDYVRIATELRDPKQVLEQIRVIARRPATRGAQSDPPRTPLESELAELWAGLLHVSAVGIHDNFFEFGGHSLLAVQLLSRVRQIHGVDLSLEVVYSGDFTVAELAKAVELKEMEQSGADYQELLRELEGLSDEEVRALLAEEQDTE